MNAAEREARARVEEVFRAIDRLTPDDLALTPTGAPDLDARAAQIDELEAAARRVGRATFLDEAREAVRDALARRVVSRFRAEVGVLGVTTGGRAEDIAALALALEDAVAVAATEDLIDPLAAAALADPGRRVLGLEPLPLSSVEPVPAASAWEPAPEDWADSIGAGPLAVDHEQPMAGNRRLQTWFFGIVGAAATVAVLLIGIDNDQLLLAALGALAVAGLAWIFARYRWPINRP